MKKVDLSGLDNFNVSDLMSEKPLETAGKALMIPIENIVEDAQVRKEMDPEALKELAASIHDHGVKSPISVRSADAEGNFRINYGHRRFRASKIAGMSVVPAFIDDEHTDFHQVIENIHREELSPMEIAHFIERRLKAGDKKAEIAKTLGKSGSFVSDHAAMLEMNPVVLDLYDTGHCRSVQVLANLYRAYKKHPEKVESFCQKVKSDLTAARVRTFTESLKQEQNPRKEDKISTDQKIEDSSRIPVDLEEIHITSVVDVDVPTNDNKKDETGPDNIKVQENINQLMNPVVQVLHNDRPACLILNRRPEGVGRAWLRYSDDGGEIEADLVQVELVAVIEG